MPGTGQCSYMSITSTTRWCILIIRLYLLIIIIIQVIIRVGILIEARVPVDVIRVKDQGLLGPVQVYLPPHSIHGVFPLFGSAARWQFQKSTALPEFVMRKDNVRVY